MRGRDLSAAVGVNYDQVRIRRKNSMTLAIGSGRRTSSCVHIPDSRASLLFSRMKTLLDTRESSIEPYQSSVTSRNSEVTYSVRILEALISRTCRLCTAFLLTGQ